jgi:hypothetical protein
MLSVYRYWESALERDSSDPDEQFLGYRMSGSNSPETTLLRSRQTIEVTVKSLPDVTYYQNSCRLRLQLALAPIVDSEPLDAAPCTFTDDWPYGFDEFLTPRGGWGIFAGSIMVSKLCPRLFD